MGWGRRSHQLGAPSCPKCSGVGKDCDACKGSGLAATPKQPRRYQESKYQRETVKWLRGQGEPVMRLENAAQRTPEQYVRDRAMGMEPGAPDLILPRLFVYLEMKDDDGKVSAEQNEMHRILRLCGYTVLVAYNFDEAKQQVAPLIQAANERRAATADDARDGRDPSIKGLDSD